MLTTHEPLYAMPLNFAILIVEMKPAHLFIILAFVATDLFLIFSTLIGHNLVTILTPHGWIAFQQRHLMLTLTSIMLIVVVPVLIGVFYIGWKYREGNQHKNKYTPDVDHNHGFQTLLWLFPFLIIVVMSIINWQTAHQLDPFRPIVSTAKPMTIQVVALRWKWLFIYPEQGIATVNYVAFPEKTPITFYLTADAPLNSFWIPQLGGQMYAMPGMSNRLHLIANETGDFPGSTAELSGAGFAGMRFRAKSLTQNDFDAWVSSVKQSSQTLNMDTYNKLAEPSEDTPPAFYASTEDDLYNTIIMKFMGPHKMDSRLKYEAGSEQSTPEMMPGMKM